MVNFQYLKIMCKILVAKYQGYKSIRTNQRLYPRVKKKLEKRGYLVKENSRGFIFTHFTEIEWGLFVC